MNPYLRPYYPEQVNYYPAAYYRPAQIQDLIPVVAGIAMMIALGAWAFSQVKKSFQGEEVKFPL